MSEISERLRSARERLGLNQQQFGALGGVSRNAQFTYESGKRAPDTDYLTALAKSGVDVGHVLTGMRTYDQLDARIANLVEDFLQLSAAWQDVVTAVVKQANQSESKAAAPTLQSSRQDFHAE